MFRTSGEFIEVINPSTSQPLGNFHIDDPSTLDRRLEDAERAFKDWGALSSRERGKYVLRVRDVIYGRMDDIARLISETTGKPKVEALTAELIPMLHFIPYFVKRAPHLLADREISLHLFKHKKSMLRFEPYGVIAILSPWNYPFSIPMGDMVFALLAGNTVVVKTSEAALPVARVISEIFQEAAFPKGVVNVAFGDGRTGAYLVSSPRVKKIVFTGSTGIGRKILEAAAKNITPCLMELGGKDAAIVCGDADLEKAAKGIVWGAFTNAGQTCASVERVYVARDVIQPFSELVVSEIEKLRLREDVGAITLDTHMERYQKQLEDALRKGAKILTGGSVEKKEKGSFFQPTALINVSHDMEIMREETFGPILPLMMVDSEGEGIRLANDSIYGLCASVWTKNIRRGIDIARKIEVGTVTVNDVLYTHALGETPWGGYKASGLGRVHSDQGLREFAQIKHINYDRVPLRPFWWFPYTKNTYQTVLAFARFLAEPRWRKKIGALFAFLRYYFSRR